MSFWAKPMMVNLASIYLIDLIITHKVFNHLVVSYHIERTVKTLCHLYRTFNPIFMKTIMPISTCKMSILLTANYMSLRIPASTMWKRCCPMPTAVPVGNRVAGPSRRPW